ncbi:MAG: SMP-30/gluconolactonase/LRE family protein [Phycisphaerae bacterium]
MHATHVVLLTAVAVALMTGTVWAAEPARVEVLDDAFKQVADADAVVRRIGGDFQFTEGPTWYAAEACLLFSDIPANRIYKWTAQGGLKVWREPSHQANGNTTDNQGRLVTCEHATRRVTRTAKDDTVEVLCDSYKGKRLNSPNDVAVRRDGTIWFTDPPYGLRGREQEQPACYVFRLDPGAKEPVVVADDFTRPNGIAFSPDQKHLYVANSDGKASHVRRFRVTEENTLADGKIFCGIRPGAPDGIRCDADGRLYASAGDGVQVFSPEGKLIGKIRTPQAAANCCFGGADGKTFFITARKSVWAVRLKVSGAR